MCERLKKTILYHTGKPKHVNIFLYLKILKYILKYQCKVASVLFLKRKKYIFWHDVLH